MLNVMAAQPNIGGAVCESSVIPFLVPRRKIWLTPDAGVPCGNAANIREHKTWGHKVNFAPGKILSVARDRENVLQCSSPGDGQTSCEVWLAYGERRRCSNEGKTRNPLNLLGCPKLANRPQPLMGRSSPYCETCGGHIVV